MRPVRLPLTLICGLAGAGKTTMADYLRAQDGGRRVGVIRAGVPERAFDDVRRIAKWQEFDYLLLEASGSSDPEWFAARLTADSRVGAELAELVRLDTIVTVVDAASLLRNFASWDRLAEHGSAADARDDRVLVEVITEQVEFADVVVLNKVDRASPVARRNAGVLVKALNPDAVLVECEFGCVPPHKVLATHCFWNGSQACHGIRSLAIGASSSPSSAST